MAETYVIHRDNWAIVQQMSHRKALNVGLQPEQAKRLRVVLTMMEKRHTLHNWTLDHVERFVLTGVPPRSTRSPA